MIYITKKILSIFLISLLSIFQIWGYFYDNKNITYDIRDNNNTYIIKVDKKDSEKISYTSNVYNFNDGSTTAIKIK
jgi:hypothetical protein